MSGKSIMAPQRGGSRSTRPACTPLAVPGPLVLRAAGHRVHRRRLSALTRTLTLRDEVDDLTNKLPFKQWGVSLVGHFDDVHVRAPCAHRRHRLSRQQIRIGAAN